MILFHFTSGGYLRGIARHGLTVGDVPTDISRNKGLVGIWLTSSETPSGHGLDGGAVNKAEFRLTVEISEPACGLVRWQDWSTKNVTAKTIDLLHSVAAKPGIGRPETWYIHFPVIPPERIIACVETKTGLPVDSWGDAWPVELDLPPVPPWRRAQWHKSLLEQVRRAAMPRLTRAERRR